MDISKNLKHLKYHKRLKNPKHVNAHAHWGFKLGTVILREGGLWGALIKAGLPEGGFAKKTDSAKRGRFCRESPIRSGKSSFVIEGWCDEGTELEHAAENGVKRDEVGRGSRLYGADNAKK